MSRLCLLAAAAILVVGVGACGDESNGVGSVRFTDPAGRFEVTFPAEPRETPGAIPLQDGSSLDYLSYQATDGSGEYFAVCIEYDTPATDVQQTLQATLDGMVSAVNGTLVSQDDTELQGRPGLKFVFTARSGGAEMTLIGRVFEESPLVTCQLIASSSSDGDADAFLESFEFLEPAS